MNNTYQKEIYNFMDVPNFHGRDRGHLGKETKGILTECESAQLMGKLVNPAN